MFHTESRLLRAKFGVCVWLRGGYRFDYYVQIFCLSSGLSWMDASVTYHPDMWVAREAIPIYTKLARHAHT